MVRYLEESLHEPAPCSLCPEPGYLEHRGSKGVPVTFCRNCWLEKRLRVIMSLVSEMEGRVKCQAT